MSRHRKLKALDYDQEYDDYYNSNLDDSFLDQCSIGEDGEENEDEFDISDDEIEDFEARYLNTGIDLNLNSTQTTADQPADADSCGQQNVEASTNSLGPSSSRAGVTASENLLKYSLDNLNLNPSTFPIFGFDGLENKAHPPKSAGSINGEKHLDTLTEVAIQHLNHHQWQLPLLEMDCIFRDKTYFRHYADPYKSNLQSKLGLFMADLKFKKQSFQNHARSRNLYRRSQMFSLLVDYYKSLHTGFFSFTTPSPDEEIAIGCRFGSKGYISTESPLQLKKPTKKKSLDETASQQTRFEYTGAKKNQTKTTNKSAPQEPSASTSAHNHFTQSKKVANKQPDITKKDETIRVNFDASKIKQTKIQDNKSYIIPGSKLSAKYKSIDLSTIKPHKMLLAKGNPPKQLQSLADKRKIRHEDASNKHIGPTKKDLEAFHERSKENLKDYKRSMYNVKPSINLIVVGHVDAGKSTLVGHLLFKLGLVSNKLMHRYTTDSQKLGKASFKFAWILDETDEERLRGVTMDLASTRFETQHRDINLLDAPGHSDFIPSVITGAAQADSAILVVDATIGEFETGFARGGQTREHTILIRSLGVKSLVVAVNKMDNIDWSETRFKYIVEQLKPFIKQVGYNTDNVKFVPCSGLSGCNLTDKLVTSKDSSHPQLERHWYNGPSLLDCLDEVELPERAVDKPIRLCVTDVFKGISSGVFLSGTIDGGQIQEKQKLLLMPQNETCEIKSIEVKNLKTNQAFAGDLVTLVATGIDLAKYYRGSILCDPVLPTSVTNRFQSRIVTFNDIDTILIKGSPVEIHMNGMTESGGVRKLVSLLNKSTGDLIQKRPRCITKNSSAVIEIVTSRVLCVELYENYQNLGRILIRSVGKTIAAGLICKICRPKKEKSKKSHGK